MREIFYFVAGGGKTTKLLSLINERSLVLTFNKHNADDLLSKGYNAMTLHSLCFNFMKIVVHEFHHYLLNNNVNDQEKSRKIGKLVENYTGYYLEDLSELDIEDIKYNTILKNHLSILNEKYTFINQLIRKFLENKYDFIHLIDEKYDFLLIDEIQDFSLEQLNLIYFLIEEIFVNKKGFCLFGDPHQSIYSFQAASPLYLKAFEKQLSKFNVNIHYSLTSYRFGHNIAQLSSNLIEKTIIANKEDYLYYLDDLEMIPFVIEDLLKSSYKIDDIMILFNYHNSAIQKLQEKLTMGFGIKIWLQNNNIIEALHHINSYLSTPCDWYKAKILLGPFFSIDEKLFHFINIKTYESSWFEKINIYLHELMPLLCKKFYGTTLDLFIWQKLCELAEDSYTLPIFLRNLPETITIQTKGIQFLTVHASKGLQNKIVFYIDNKKRNQNTYINHYPYFFFNKINEFTSEFAEKQNEIQLQEEINKKYVAYTRAQERLYIVNI